MIIFDVCHIVTVFFYKTDDSRTPSTVYLLQYPALFMRAQMENSLHRSYSDIVNFHMHTEGHM